MTGYSLQPSPIDLTAVASAVGFSFWALFAVAVLVRLAMAVRRRRLSDIRAELLQPITRAGAIQSEAYGWRPAENADLQPLTAEARNGSDDEPPLVSRASKS